LSSAIKLKLMKKLRINEVLRVQGNNSAQDAVDLGTNCVGVTVRCLQDSPANIYVGWNEQASPKNLLEPGDNVSYGNIEGCVLDGNRLYVGYAGAGARVLISILNDTGEECA
jgi:hypothetical protein